MLIVPRFYYIYRRSGAKIVATRPSYLEVRNSTKIYLRYWGSLQRSPDSVAGGEGARKPLPKNLTPPLSIGPRFTILPSPGKKSYGRPWVAALLNFTSTHVHITAAVLYFAMCVNDAASQLGFVLEYYAIQQFLLTIDDWL